jgi:Effector protein/RTX calcium-binding nonapeptide repeat (4 copies)
VSDPDNLGPVSTAEPPPAPLHPGDLWQLNASPETVEQAAQAWTKFGQEARDAAQFVSDRAERLYAEEWAGDVADTYTEHERKLNRDIRSAADLADGIAGELLRTATALTAAQRQLDDSFHEVSSLVTGVSTADGPVFSPQNDQEVNYVEAAMRDAQFIRERLDEQLLDFQVAITRTRSDWTTMAAAWDAVSSGTVEPFTMPPEVTGTYVIFDGDTVVVNTGTGDDKVKVDVDPATGEQIVTVNGVTNRYPPEAQITIRTGEGNDEVAVAKGTRVQLTLIGGQGNDTIRGGDGAGDTILGNAGRDHLYGGSGADRISGGTDRDYIDGGDGSDVLSGNAGNDTIYGMGGDDRISGGDGQDYLEGAQGNDIVDGGAGNDMVSGGRGDDTLFGGTGDDKVYGGFGTDNIHAGTGDDTVFSQTDDQTSGAEKVVTVELKDLGSFIKIDGSPEFVARTEADLDMLRSSPRGQEMLAALEAKNDTFISDTVTISEVSGGNEVTSYPIVDHSSIDYNPGKDHAADDRPPISGLYHELAHVYDHEYGTGADGTYTGADNPGVDNDEREAVGLPIDHDDDPSTPDQLDPDHPWNLTENGLREELGAPPRTTY